MIYNYKIYIYFSLHPPRLGIDKSDQPLTITMITTNAFNQVVEAQFDNFGDADSSGQAATCEQGFVIEGSG